VTTVDTTLAERGQRYGDFNEHARITQNLKRAMQDSPNWNVLADDQKETLEMLAHKLGRILNGDPDYHDSWHDIIGYTRLVEKRLARPIGFPEINSDLVQIGAAQANRMFDPTGK
jgi:hypothetical protein